MNLPTFLKNDLALTNNTTNRRQKKGEAAFFELRQATLFRLTLLSIFDREQLHKNRYISINRKNN